MRNWLIELLGGVTKEEYNAVIALCETHYEMLQAKLDEALKNDGRDPKTGRFVKK
jgi:hypothetical protein